ncbi:MAG: hypothetical protein RJQ03_00935 [Miltoncostaeaceae bacterium]
MSASARDDGWRARVRVEPAEGEPFETDLAFESTDLGEPQAGDLVEVIHAGRRAIPLTDPLQVRRPDPPAAAPAAGEDDPPAAHEVIAQVMRHLTDGSLAGGGPAIIVDDPDAPDERPVGLVAGTDPELDGATLADLIALAGSDPARVGDEVLRRITSGRTSFDLVIEEARATGPAGHAAVDSVLDDLSARGLLTQRMLTVLKSRAG